MPEELLPETRELADEAYLLSTGSAPPFRPPVEAETPRDGRFSHLPERGERIGDFDLLRVLGAGSFARVYLAKQVSLGRQVALKVSDNRGSEARTLASLEHEHVVKVFSESVDAERGLRLLCMQYVPGITLERLIRALEEHKEKTWDGGTVVALLDELCRDPVPFDPAALRGREALASCDASEAACWLGTRLAEALAHAHSQGVLHRDLKPANILMNRYGRPFLADFNISAATQDASAESVFGGTLIYMAPEHIDAFNPADPTPQEAVDQRSDVFSLGVVLCEFLTGRIPFPMPPADTRPGNALRALADIRRVSPPELGQKTPPIADALRQTLRSCLAPNPAQRCASASDLAASLGGCLRLRRIERRLPPAGRLLPALRRRPFLALVGLLLLMNACGSAVNIAYNAAQIVGGLDAVQQHVFKRLVLAYNALVYPGLTALTVAVLLPIVRAWRRLHEGDTLESAEAADLRRRLLSLPGWAFLVVCAGWFPGAVVFPLGIHLFANPLPLEAWGHFFVSFAVSGLIALTYSYLGVLYIVLRILYPQVWSDPRDVQSAMRAELGPRRIPLRSVQLLAGAIPLAGAMLMIGVGPESTSAAGYQTFRLLTASLIALGMAGFGAALTICGQLEKTLSLYLGEARQAEGA